MFCGWNDHISLSAVGVSTAKILPISKHMNDPKSMLWPELKLFWNSMKAKQIFWTVGQTRPVPSSALPSCSEHCPGYSDWSCTALLFGWTGFLVMRMKIGISTLTEHSSDGVLPKSFCSLKTKHAIYWKLSKCGFGFHTGRRIGVLLVCDILWVC